MSTLHDTLVLGAGISGLAYAHARGPTADVVVLEAAARPGGLITTHAADGLHVECGPEALQDDAPRTRELLAALGLRAVPADERARHRWVLGPGGLVSVPTDPQAFLKSPLLSKRGKLRALSEPFRERGVALEGSVADFVQHRLGDEVLRELVDPILSGIYAGSPATTSLRAAFPKLHALAAEHGSILRGMSARAKERKARGEPRPAAPSLLSVDGGLQRLPEALAARLGDRLHLQRPARALRRLDDDAWEVDTDAGTLRARRCVLAMPARAASLLLAASVPELSRMLGEMLAESVISVAHAWPRADVRHALDGFGYLVPGARGLRHLGTLFSSSIMPGRCPADVVVMRTLFGGARDPDAAALSDDALLALLRAEVAPLLGLPAGSPRMLHVTRWTSVLPRYDLAQPVRQERMDVVLAGLPGLAILGNHRRGIAVNALIESAGDLARAHAAQDATR